MGGRSAQVDKLLLFEVVGLHILEHVGEQACMPAEARRQPVGKNEGWGRGRRERRTRDVLAYRHRGDDALDGLFALITVLAVEVCAQLAARGARQPV